MADGLPAKGLDPCSFANVLDFVISHCHLELRVDFSSSKLDGFAELTFSRKVLDNNIVVLDTRDLTIKQVQCNGEDLQFQVLDPHKVFGSQLQIRLPKHVNNEKFKLKIFYETSPNSTALQWLRPEQTAGKKHPYLYSQCQAIHARSLVPCQDTPAIKMTYTAKISVPKDLVALMSAVKLTTEEDSTDDTQVCCAFEQKVPIPSYLLAVVVGALEYRTIGPRSKVWSEKETIDAAAHEFAKTEDMLATAEKLMGPYEWGVYDLLVLPPSFPYGGMENPCLTFVTPTLLAGDRSLAQVVAHEIAHSWTGNLVTNKTHEHFWLNEGHTVFVERKIAGRLNPKGEAFRHFEAYGGWKELVETVKEFGKDHPYNALVLDVKGVDPDDAFSRIPYEKGSALLMYLEQKLGGPEVFEPFLKAYVMKFKRQSISTEEWKDFLYEFFSDKKNILNEVDWDEWFYGRNICPAQPVFDKTLLESLEHLGERWLTCNENELKQFSSDDLQELSAFLQREFISYLMEGDFTPRKFEKMEEIYKFGSSKNAEIKFRWLRLAIKTRMKNYIGSALDFVNQQGRMKYVRPLYRDMYQWEDSRAAAVENFQSQRQYMHNTTVKGVAKDLHLNN